MVTQAVQDIWKFEHGQTSGAYGVTQSDYLSALWFLKRITTEQYKELMGKLDGAGANT